QVYDLPESELATPELELPDVVLRAPGLIAGRVLDGADKGLAGVEIELGGANADRARFSLDAAHGSSDVPGGPQRTAERGQYSGDRRQTTSDAHGRFWFGDVASGSYRLVTRYQGRPESAPVALELGPGERREDLVVRLTAGAGIHGQVVDEDGRPLAGV